MPRTHAVGSRFAFSLLLLAAVLAAPIIARAQYLYLDSNGDGVHTAADVLQPSGTTTVDVWLRTDHNRDGSAASCVTQDGALTINSYTFILHAENGTVSWGSITNRIPEFDIPYLIQFQGSEYHAGYASATILPAGDYRLATLPITVAGGTPTIRVAAATSLNATMITSFGSQCFGTDFDNTLKLGLDWSDADGLGFGGAANQPPVLDPPASMTVTEGQTADQPLTASDPDGQPLSFFRASGQGFVVVSTTQPGLGHATGAVHLAPNLFQGGSYTVAIGVSDGITSDEKPMHVDVLQGQGITFDPIPPMTVDAYSRASRIVVAQDAEFRAISVSKASGPPYMRVNDLGANRGEVVLEPGLDDAGTTAGAVIASDGLTELVQSFPITVNPLPACAPGWCAASRDFANPFEFPIAVGAADMNGDGRPDLVSANYGVISVRFGRGNGTFDPPRMTTINPTLGALQKFGVGDLNGDGLPDVVATLATEPILDRTNLVPYYNAGNGILNQGPPLANGRFHDRAAIGDLNGDGRADVAAGDEGTGLVSIIMQTGAGTFAPATSLAAGRPNGVVIADFDGDGRQDVAALELTHLFLFPGHGDGTFGFARISNVPSFGGQPLVMADFDRDGRPDLATVLESSSPGGASVMRNIGGGLFASVLLRFPGRGISIGAGDLSGDGIPDLVVGGFGFTDNPALSVYRGDGDGTFSSRQDLFGAPHRAYYFEAAVADWNGDGRDDATLCSFFEMPTFLSRAYTPLPNRPPTIWSSPTLTLRQGENSLFNVMIDDPDDEPLGRLAIDRSSLPSGVSVTLYSSNELEGRYLVRPMLERPIPPTSYPIILSIEGTSIRSTTNLIVTGEPQFLAADVLTPGSGRAIALSSRAPVPLAVEPSGGSFRAEDILLYSVVLHGEAILPEIFPLAAKGGVLTDLDHDGVQELELDFARTDMARLFGGASGRREAHGAIEGRLADGRWFRAPATLTLVGSAPTSLASVVAPNPLNPNAVLTFDLPREGPVRIGIFDPAGRRVRTVLDGMPLPAGTHDVRLDGRDEQGLPLASGVYFYRIDTAAGRQSGRFAVLK